MLILMTIFLVIYSHRYSYIMTTATADSTLQVKLAMNISAGNWLGKYNEVTLAKGLSFPLLLVVFHFLRIPFQLGIGLFNIISVVLFEIVIVPYFKHKRAYSLAILFILLFNPVLLQCTMALPYRDSTAYGSIIILMTWIIGAVLNLMVDFYKQSFNVSVICGCFGLFYWNNLREDSSWIYPFIFCALFVCLLATIKYHRFVTRAVACIVFPIMSLAICNSIIAYQNYTHYNRFVVNEYKSRDFKAAIGTMSAIKNRNWVINVPVNSAARTAMYKNVPVSRKLQKYLDTNASGNVQGLKYVGVKEPSFGNDYQGGWFPWAYRGALVRAYHIHDSAEMKKYNNKLAQEIVQASRQGKIAGPTSIRRSLVAPYNSKIVRPIMLAIIPSFSTFFQVRDYVVDIPKLSGQNIKIRDKMIKYLNVVIPRSNNNSVIPKKILIPYKKIYVFIQFILTMTIMLECFYVLLHSVWKRDWNSLWVLLIVLGLGLSIIERILMLIYVSITSFAAIFTQYLVSAYALLSIMIISGLLLFDRYLWKNKGEKNG